MAINRMSFSSTIPAEKQQSINKVIVVNTTMTGYLHIVAVRTEIKNEQPVEVFTDILIHPDRAANVDVAKFDAISIQGMKPRQAPGEARPNTTYAWAAGATAMGKHLVKPIKLETGEDALELCGVGLYGEPQQEA